MVMGVVCCCSYTSFHLDSSMLLPKLQGRVFITFAEKARNGTGIGWNQQHLLMHK